VINFRTHLNKFNKDALSLLEGISGIYREGLTFSQRFSTKNFQKLPSCTVKTYFTVHSNQFKLSVISLEK
jgi:hypothetical protein